MKIRAVLFVVFATTLTLHASSRVNPNGPYDFSHNIPVKPGLANLTPGDSITVDAISGSADKIAEGNIYKIDGHYTLQSRDNANLTAGVTSEDTSRHPAVKNGTVEIARGDGTFSVYMYVWHAGDPHVCLYPDNKGDDSIDCLYFNGPDSWSQKR